MGVGMGLLAAPIVLPIFWMLWPVWALVILIVVGGGGYMYAKKGLRMRDVRFFGTGIAIQVEMRLAERKNRTVDQLWDATVAARGRGAPAFAYVDTGEYVTFGQMDDDMNRIASWALARGLGAGDVVALFGTNRPRYVAVWLGLAKVGVQTALINSNQTGAPLVHSLVSARASVLLYDAALSEAVDGIQDKLEEGLYSAIACVCLDDPGQDEEDGDACEYVAWEDLDRAPIAPEERAAAKGVLFRDPLIYIYTSGTTGLPKAAIITHFRYQLGACAFSKFAKATGNDRVYTTLPLYHSAAGIVGVGMVLYAGSMMVLRSKFSASSYTRDVVKYDVTIVQYIGELCRYLLSAPPRDDDANHSVRLAMGNGLRPDVWNRFKSRFGVDTILEFYAATEGAAAIINTENKDFSIGYVSRPLQKLLPQRIIKYDRMTDQPIRGPDGFCIDTDPDEPGEFIAKIITSKSGASTYNGYTNDKASAKKVLRDVFVQGDSYFRSGDLVKRDAEGFVYFCDRLGDTFRWKGENVATTEVSQACAEFDPNLEFNVYGVTVGDISGRAGMVGIVGADPAGFDFSAFAAHVSTALPTYAQPLFIRFLPAMDLTGTFKHKKVTLRDQGFDPATVADPLFFRRGDTFVPIDDALHGDIVSGAIRL